MSVCDSLRIKNICLKQMLKATLTVSFIYVINHRYSVHTMVQYNRVEQPTRHIVGYFWDNLMSQMIQLPVS